MCSEIQNDEEISGWKAGKSVGYCEECCLRMLDQDQTHQSESVCSSSGQQLEKKIER